MIYDPVTAYSQLCTLCDIFDKKRHFQVLQKAVLFISDLQIMQKNRFKNNS